MACIECRRRKIACDKKLPHCTECLVHGRECCYSRDKRRRLDDDGVQPPTHSVNSVSSSYQALPPHSLDSGSRPVTSGFAHHSGAPSLHSRQGSTSDHSHANLQSSPKSGSRLSLSSSIPDALGGNIPDAVNDTFWWLASQWQTSLTSDPFSQWPEWTNSFIDPSSTRQDIPTSTSGNALPLSDASNGGASIQDPAPLFPAAQTRTQASGELYQAYRRCLPERKRWPKLFKALEKLCRTAHSGSETDTSPFLCLSKLQAQLELDTALAQGASNAADPALSAAAELLEGLPPSAAIDLPLNGSSTRPPDGIPNQTDLSSSSKPDTLRCAWTLSAICLADSMCASSPIELPPHLSMDLDDAPNATVLLFSVAWDHCRKALCGDAIEVMQTYRMMSLAFSRCHQGQELASASVFLGCRAAATMSIHRAATIARLGTPLEQQQALNAFWHLVSQGCHYQAWQGRDMPIDLALVDLPMPDPKVGLQHTVAPASPSHLADGTAAVGQSPRSQLLSSSPVFMTRIWTSVAIGQTIERHYRQGASLLVPCEERLEVATPKATRPSQQEQDHVKQTTKALDFCASLLQTREPASAETKESQLKRFVLMLVRYTRVLLHYPFCRVDRDHRKAAQESISAIVSTVLGTLLGLASDAEDQSDDGGGSEEDCSSNGGFADAHGSVRTRLSMSHGSRRSRSGVAPSDPTRTARVDRHLLELLAGLSVRALVFTMALIKHPVLPIASDFASNGDDSDRQRSDAVLALGALEQLQQHGVVSPSVLRKARRIARRSGGI